MSKNFLHRFLLSTVAVLVAVFWILSITVPDTFGFFSLTWAIAIFAGLAGILYVIKGLLSSNIVTLKKLDVIIGCVLIAISIVSIIYATGNNKDLVLPIILLVVTVCLMLSTVVAGGKKWDQGDNENVGYKNYHERKAEALKKEAEAKEE